MKRPIYEQLDYIQTRQEIDAVFLLLFADNDTVSVDLLNAATKPTLIDGVPVIF